MKYSWLFLLCCAFSFSSLAQQVKGKVKDEKGEPLAGVTIALKGSSSAAQTNDKGDSPSRLPVLPFWKFLW